MRNRRSLLLAAAGLLVAFSTAASAQSDYPNRPIRLIIPFPAGGSNDIVGRAIAQQMGEKLGKQVVVDNRTGAGGVIGTELASKEKPDGYTILVISIAHSVNPWLYKLRYDPIKDITPIIQMDDGPFLLAMHPSLPVRSVRELVALGKARRGEITYATSGQGSISHLSMELFALLAGVQFTHVPYKGNGQSISDTIAGQTQILFAAIAAV